MKLCLSFVVVLFCYFSRAQEPIVDSRLIDDSEIWMGQKVKMIVELKAPGFFSGVAAFDLPEVPGMILIPPTDRPVLSSETIDDTSYTVQRHELDVLVRQSGAQSVPPFLIRFGYKRSPLDAEVVSARIRTPELTLIVQTPPGSEGLGAIISTRSLTADESWDPEPGEAVEGEAFTRTVRFAAPDVPSMAFPPFPANPIDGFGIYPKEPELNDRNERGRATGERIERITYVCERAGEFTIPAVRFTWFDLEAQELRVIDFPERHLTVSANPNLQRSGSVSAEPSDGTRSSDWLWLVGGAAAVLVSVWKLAAKQRVLRFFSHLRPVRLQPLKPRRTLSKIE